MSQSAYNDLAALVSKLGSDLSEFGAELSGDVKDHGEQLGQLAERITGLREDVDGLLDAMPPEQKHPQVDWPSLTAEDAEGEWQALGQWVATVLVPWYRPTRRELPDCWPLHPTVVVELSTLKTARLQAFERTSAPAAGMEWHDRWRPGVMRRIAEHVERDRKIADVDGERCRPGRHLQPDDQQQAPTGQQQAPTGQQWQQPAQPGPWSAPGAPGYGQPAPAAPSAGSGFRPHVEDDELAEPRHWWGALQQVAEADVRSRRQREAEQHQQDRTD